MNVVTAMVHQPRRPLCGDGGTLSVRAQLLSGNVKENINSCAKVSFF